MRNTLFIIALIFSIFNALVYCSDESNIFPSPLTSSISPELSTQSITTDDTFKIEATLRDEDDIEIIIDEDDVIFDNMKCLINGTIEMHKYIDFDGNFVCVATSCQLRTQGQTTVVIKHLDDILKEYDVDVSPGRLVGSKTKYHISPSYSPLGAGSTISFLMTFYDQYDNLIKVETDDYIYNNIKCQLGYAGVTKSVSGGKLQCVFWGEQMSEVGNHQAIIKYEDDDHVEILKTHDYETIPSGELDLSKSVISYGQPVYAFMPIHIHVQPRDPFGNPNADYVTYSTARIKLKKGSSLIKDFGYNSLDSNNKYITSNPGNGGTGYHLEICDMSNRCQNTSTFTIRSTPY